MNTWKVILATLVIFATGVVTGGLLVSYSNRAQQKHHRPWLRETSNRRADAGQPAANLREAVTSGLSGARPQGSSGPLPQGLRMDFLLKLDRELRLSAEQRARIEKIIAEGQEHNQQLWSRVLPEMRREIQATKERIRAELQPEQVKRYEELMKQSRPAGQRRGDDPMSQPDRRLRDQPRRSLPPREGSLPEGSSLPRTPAQPPANP